MFIVRGWILGLSGPEFYLFNYFFIVGNNHASAGGCDNFIAVKGKKSGHSKCAWRFSFILSAQCFCGILQQGNFIFVTYFFYGINIGRLAIQMDQNNCFGEAVFSCPFFHLTAQKLWIHIPTLFVGINKNRTGTKINNGICAPNKGKGGTKHLVLRTDARIAQQQMKRGRTGGNCRRILGIDFCGKFPLKTFQLGPDRRYIIRGKGLMNKVQLFTPHMGSREKYPFIFHVPPSYLQRL